MDDVVFTAYRAGDERALSRPAVRNGAGDSEPSARVARFSLAELRQDLQRQLIEEGCCQLLDIVL